MGKKSKRQRQKLPKRNQQAIAAPPRRGRQKWNEFVMMIHREAIEKEGARVVANRLMDTVLGKTDAKIQEWRKCVLSDTRTSYDWEHDSVFWEPGRAVAFKLYCIMFNELVYQGGDPGFGTQTDRDFLKTFIQDQHSPAYFRASALFLQAAIAFRVDKMNAKALGFLRCADALCEKAKAEPEEKKHGLQISGEGRDMQRLDDMGDVQQNVQQLIQIIEVTDGLAPGQDMQDALIFEKLKHNELVGHMETIKHQNTAGARELMDACKGIVEYSRDSHATSWDGLRNHCLLQYCEHMCWKGMSQWKAKMKETQRDGGSEELTLSALDCLDEKEDGLLFSVKPEDMDFLMAIIHQANNEPACFAAHAMLSLGMIWKAANPDASLFLFQDCVKLCDGTSEEEKSETLVAWEGCNLDIPTKDGTRVSLETVGDWLDFVGSRAQALIKIVRNLGEHDQDKAGELVGDKV